MKPFVSRPASCLKGEIFLSGDKSIAHRAAIISALSKGRTLIENFPPSKDCLATLAALKKLGVEIRIKYPAITVFGRGLDGLKKTKSPIFIRESGTTFRLLLGVLAGQDFETKLVAGKSLSQRPMLRVSAPLRMMGAQIAARCSLHAARLEEYPPITIKGGRLKPITYRMPVASAQVKSAILLAGLYAKGETRVIEPTKTRDHTERMLKLFKARLKVNKNKIVIKGVKSLASPKIIYVPADISCASFFLVLAAIIPGSEVIIKRVSLNPSRLGIIRVLKRMGANLKIQNPCLAGRQAKSKIKNYEPMGDIIIKGSRLKGAIVKREEVPSLIDELPILMVAACYASGKTVFEGVEELRFKETDRIRSMSENLSRMGGKVYVIKKKESEKVIVKGVKKLKGARVRSFGDHRTAMSMVAAGLAAQGETKVDDISCIDKSFPDFIRLLKSLIK